jgi:sec-independent protein translocase protein TatC
MLKKNDNKTVDFTRPFITHISELRSLVIQSLCVWVAMTAFSYCYVQDIFAFLIKPLSSLLTEKKEFHRFIYTNLTEAFLTYLKVSFFAGTALTFPFISLGLWRFVSPGLFQRERVLFRFLLIAIPLFFCIGATFAYCIVIPTAFSFFLSFESTINSVPLQLETKISEYLTLIMRLVFAFGASFQLPVILAGMSWIGFIKSSDLIKCWRYAVVGVAILSAIITPPDAFSMIFLAVPLLFLYTLSIIIVKQIEKRTTHARYSPDQI